MYQLGTKWIPAKLNTEEQIVQHILEGNEEPLQLELEFERNEV